MKSKKKNLRNFKLPIIISFKGNKNTLEEAQIF